MHVRDQSSGIQLRRLACSVAVLALAVLASPILTSTSGQSAYAAAGGVTVTGRDHAYDPATSSLRAAAPTATVNETSDLVDQTVHVTWANETPTSTDLNDPADTVGATVDPANLSNSVYGVGVYECKGASPANIHACYLAIAGSSYGSGGLGNALYAITYPDGTGFADVHVETGVTNSTLGCDARHACSLVVVPAWGGNQDGHGSSADCNTHSQDNGDFGTALSRNVQTGACSWANRLVVPLHFAPTPADCPPKTPAFSAVGSPMLQRALTQWQSGWCTESKPLSFAYNSTSNEYQARDSFLLGGGALTSATNVALTTQPVAAKPKHFTYAPVANTDIAVAFLIDDPKTRAPLTDLTLNPRLLAKLLTQSYAPSNYACLFGGNVTKQGPSCDPAIKGNPTSIFTDPEFLALNPKLSASDFPYVAGNAFGGYFPTVLAGNSDLTYELTKWIASDKSAREFLAGHPDKWGMHINTYYKGTKYPTSQFEQLDPGYTDRSSGAIAGNGTMQNSWQPVTGLDTVGQTLVGDKASGLVGGAGSVCLPPAPCFFPKISELPGNRSLFAIMDQGQASAYSFPVAKLINGAGAAVAPSAASVHAALDAMTTNADGITRRPNFASKSAAAYPLTVSTYAMVHTCGQSASTASGVAAMLAKIAQNQKPGVRPGTLAPGYVALTRPQLAKLSAARRAVSSAPCSRKHTTTPPPSGGTHHGGNGHHGGNPNAGNGGANGIGAGNGIDANNVGSNDPGVNVGGPSTTPSPAPSAKPSPAPTPGSSSSQSPAPVPVANAIPADRAGSTRFTLPVLLIVGGLLLIAGPALFVAMNTNAGPAAAGLIRKLRR